MSDATIKSTVGIKLSPEGMGAAAKSLDTTIQRTITSLNKAASTAEKAVNSSAKAGQAATQQMNGQLKALAVTLGQIKTLQSALGAGSASGSLNSAKLLGDFGSTGTIGRQARAITDYQNSLKGASSAMTTLRDRARQFDQQAGNLAKRGQVLSNSQIMKAEKINATAKAYGKVSNEIGNLRGRVALLSSDGQKAFKPMLAGLDQLEKANAKAFSNRRRSNYQPEITATQKATQALRERLVSREKLEKKTRLNVEALRAEGLQLTRLNSLEKEAALARNVRAANSRYSNAALTGTVIKQRDTDQVNRFTRATALAATNQNKLTAALNAPNTSAARLKVLIARHNQLQREIGESIAMQNKMKTSGGGSGGGFFGGIKASAGGLFEGEGGGAYGAGALIGRVGAYALAAGAVYGVISALQQAIGFAVQFEDQLAQLQAISGSTTLEMERLSSSILSVSQNSANSVLELTKSATIIAQAGYAGAEIEGLLTNVVNLAGASGSSTDEAVDILTSALGAFQLQASEATRVTDGLVSALNDSKLSVNQVQLGLQYVGATARLQNITFNELVATLGAMADAGIRSGSTMSTGLRQMLVDFIDPSEKLITQLTKIGLTTADIDVKTLGLTTVLTRLRDAGFEAYGSLETRASAAYAVLSSNIGQIEKLEAATLKQGVAEQAQEQRLQSLSAQWQILLNELSAVGAAIGEDLTPIMQDLLVLMGGLIKVLAGLLQVVTAVIGGVYQLVSGFTDLTEGATDTSFTVEELEAALSRQGATAEEVAEITRDLNLANEDLTTSIKDTAAEMDSLETQQKSLRSEINKLIVRSDDLSQTKAGVAHQVDVLSSRFPGLRAEFSKTQGGISGLIQSLVNLDVQTSRTLANLAAAMKAKNALLNTNADQRLRSLSDDSDDIVSEGQIFSPFYAHKGTDPVRKYRSLVAAGKYQEALDFGSKNARVQQALPDSFAALAQGVSDKANAKMGMDSADRQLQAYKFASSKTGSDLQRRVMTASANGQRAVSQGSANGKSKLQIQTNLESLGREIEALEKTYADSPGVLGLLGGAQASVTSAYNGLQPEPEKAGSKGKGGGKRRGAATRAARRADRDYKRSEAAIQKEELAYRKQLLDNSIDALRNAPDLEDLPDLLDEVDVNLTDYLNNEKELAVAQIVKLNPTPAQKTKLLEAAARKAEELRIDSVGKIADVLSRAIKKFLDLSSKEIEKQYEEALRFTRRNAELSQARADGLNNPVGTNNVSDSFRTVKQREAEIAKDRYNKAQIPVNERRIERYKEIQEQAELIKGDLEAQLAYLGKLKSTAEEVGDTKKVLVVTGKIQEVSGHLRDSEEDIESVAQKTRELQEANENLKASYDLVAQSPTTFAEGLSTAFQALKIEINAADSLGQELINNLDKPLRAAHGSFKTFFTDVLSGTESISGAFKKMAATIIDAILDMVATALANQFFQLIGSAFGGFGGITASSTASLAGEADGLINAIPGIFWRGGEIKGYNRGGEIQSGLPTRDSTLIKAAKGEFMLRKPAVDSIGTDFLRSMNARGAAALNDIGSNVVPLAAQAPVETNVYVVSPEEKPTLGPNDVLAIVSNDVLKGGSTKKLIKKVVNGG